MSPEVWVFDGADERREFLAGLVVRHVQDLEELVPDEHDDPLEQLAAELDGPRQLPESPEVARLFPPALSEPQAASRFHVDAVPQQARARVEAARVVLADLTGAAGDQVEVPLDHIDAWVRTLSAVRIQWHVQLSGSAERLAEPTKADHRANPMASAITDWLAYLLEDALETLQTHGAS